MATPREWRRYCRLRTWLLSRTGKRVAMRELAPLAAAVLRGLARPATLDQITTSVADEVAGDADASRRQWLRERVREQLVSAYRPDFVQVAEAPDDDRRISSDG